MSLTSSSEIRDVLTKSSILQTVLSSLRSTRSSRSSSSRPLVSCTSTLSPLPVRTPSTFPTRPSLVVSPPSSVRSYSSTP